VGGSIQIVQGRSARIDRAQIEGDLQLFENDRRLQALRNRIGGNLQAVSNTGGLTISFNVIEGVLQCKQNTPPRPGAAIKPPTTSKKTIDATAVQQSVVDLEAV
jgi:hypothetical protein